MICPHCNGQPWVPPVPFNPVSTGEVKCPWCCGSGWVPDPQTTVLETSTAFVYPYGTYATYSQETFLREGIVDGMKRLFVSR